MFPGGAGRTDVAARLGLSLESGDYTTLGGYLFGALGRLPKTGDRVIVTGGTFEVISMDGRRVGDVRFNPAKAPSAPASPRA